MMNPLSWLNFKTKANTIAMNAAEYVTSKAKLNAIDRVLGVIEFTTDGMILDANQNFLHAVGYRLDEIVGQHHRMFMQEVDDHYVTFWRNLANGQYQQGQYQRVDKQGQLIWLEASYNPIFDDAGQVVKVVKYATVITEQKLKSFEFQGQIQAIDRVFGVIEFSLDGYILKVNDNFQQVTGYSAAEVVGNHHRMFMEPAAAQSDSYAAFWQRLGQGEFDAGVYKRIGKGGREIWLRASYNPIFDDHGKPYKIVKYATDISADRLKDADNMGQLQAIHKIMAVIAFDVNGVIQDANENFIHTVGYEKSAIIGQHHRMFVLESERESAAYRQFWQDLAEGKPQAGVFKRVGQHGKDIWLRASYNPIFDPSGKVYKIVKYATDITATFLRDLDNAAQIDSINRSLGTIEFSLDGRIQKVNQNFLSVVGYGEAEVIGQHHAMFVAEEDRHSQDYHHFWQKLAKGEFQAGVFKRQGKTGNDIWLQASYNPIFNDKGEPFKVVKFAIDISAQKVAETGLIQAVAETQQLLESAQVGDMTARIDLQGKSNQILSLSRGINTLMDMVGKILMQVKASADTINSAANDISTSNGDLSSRTEIQSHRLQDTATSMGQLANTVKQNAESAKHANQLASNATLVAERGGEAVSAVVQTMTAINESAKKIEDIIAVIDGIAFQTNILALNAAVEAARAGEQGRGFAVVAGEVRNLAQRSALAAKEVKDLIATSVSKTQEGAQLVEGAGKTMTEIVQSVKQVGNIISEISEASVAQTTGIDQVNVAVTSMDTVTKQNATLVEAAAVAAESLVDQANQLSELVSQYRLQQTPTHHSETRLNGTYH